ncbi:MAG: hypothetical protein DI539_03020 [Flavobacterium psychrophilum]|nr:MAG: hypothetical protein DI539_03020 [Flavobacterium psychrophilum]
MKNIIFFVSVMISLAMCPLQDGYPVPPDCPSRMFYIQHANNHNTFVYDANFTASKAIKDADPIHVYRINYKKGGIKEELTNMQRKMAYGVEFTKTGCNTFDFTLAAYPSKKMTLKLCGENNPRVSVHINGKTIHLKRMFLFCNKLGTSVSSINFYGKDAVSGREVTENFAIND